MAVHRPTGPPLRDVRPFGAMGIGRTMPRITSVSGVVVLEKVRARRASVPASTIAAVAAAPLAAQAGTQTSELPADSGFGGLGVKLNWLRAAVLGANDGVVSGSGITIGVATADPANLGAILLAGIAGLLAGASAMAMGEYVSVSSQRDTEEALISKERHDLTHTPEEEFDELVEVYRAQGLSEATARQVVHELTAHDPLAAHLRAEYGVHQDELTTPWHAAFASAVSFTSGFALPLLSMLLAPPGLRIPLTVGVALVGLLLTGWLSAVISRSAPARPIARNVIGGSIAMLLTWAISHLFGVATG